MDLSPRERQLLGDIESRLSLEDPRLAALLTRGTRWPGVSAWRLLAAAAVAVLLGVVLMVVGAAADRPGVIVAGLGMAVGVPSLAGVAAACKLGGRPGQ